MKPTQQLHDLGQSLWLDNITRESCGTKLGIAIAQRTYKAYRQLLDSDRWLRLANAGARPQRLLWASTGTKNPASSDVLYIKTLAALFTVNTFLTKHCLLSRTMAQWESSWKLTAAMPKR